MGRAWHIAFFTDGLHSLQPLISFCNGTMSFFCQEVTYIYFLEPEWALWLFWSTEHGRTDYVPAEGHTFTAGSMQFPFCEPCKPETTVRRWDNLRAEHPEKPSCVESTRGGDIFVKGGGERETRETSHEPCEWGGEPASWPSVLATSANPERSRSKPPSTLPDGFFKTVLEQFVTQQYLTGQNRYLEGRRCCHKKDLKQVALASGSAEVGGLKDPVET